MLKISQDRMRKLPPPTRPHVTPRLLRSHTVVTVEKHYAPFVRELRERARWFMEKGEDLAKVDCTIFTRSGCSRKQIQ